MFFVFSFCFVAFWPFPLAVLLERLGAWCGVAGLFFLACGLWAVLFLFFLFLAACL